MRKEANDYYWRLMLFSGILMIISFIITFLMVIRIIPELHYSLSFLTYAVSFFGLYLFLYSYYQYVAVEKEDSLIDEI
ncbi:MAG: hypothetical protein B6U95_01460 [Thermofilum sp. ex4484_82]|nr:MAG: hypothetical protein B6U95_01460 [Thermofilum sp. ex4484_82]OYT39679.1 MAG: hypothetical protein B6U96_01465 [Archaeoglobales archaeon ex4484_92]